MTGEPPSTTAAARSCPVVDAADTQNEVAVDPSRWGSLLAEVLGAEGVGVRASASLTFVSEAEMAALNAEHLGGDGPTDVLSFPIDGLEARAAGSGSADTPPAIVGDVVVCPKVAERNAAARGRELDDEIALLVVHGGLHLVGWDHGDDAARSAMWERQRELLLAFHGVAADPDDVRPGECR
ncbi:MAG: rRNA maturation RNase YbeY [Acidimicrobiales bacterium]